MNKKSIITGTSFVLLMLLIGACGQGGGSAVDSVSLRSDFSQLEKSELLDVLKAKHLHCPGEGVQGQLKNQFEPVVLRDQKIVNDHSTGLMWQQDEVSTRFTWKEAEAYVARMNEEKFAGYEDWRLPTVEEAASLLTSKKKGEYFIDPLFHKELLNTWTSDGIKEVMFGAWFIDYANGKVTDGNRAAGLGQVRLVRSF